MSRIPSEGINIAGDADYTPRMLVEFRISRIARTTHPHTLKRGIPLRGSKHVKREREDVAVDQTYCFAYLPPYYY